MKIEKLYHYILGLLIFFQVVMPKHVPIFIALALSVGIYGILKKKFEWKMPLPFKLILLLFGLYFIGTFFSKDPSLAAKYMEYKLSFVAFPLLFSMRPKNAISLYIPSIALLLGLNLTMVVVLINFGLSLLHHSLIESLSTFSSFHHPTYFASYLFVGMVIAVHGYRKMWKGFNKVVVFPFLALAVICYFLTVSLAAFLFAGLFVLVMLWRIALQKWGLIKSLALGMASVLFFVAGVLFSPLKADFEQTYSSVLKYVESPSEFVAKGNRYLTGNETRLILWTVAAKNIYNHPFGVGTASVDYYTTQELVKYDMIDMASYKYNPHNQYLQVWLEIGFIGLGVFLAMLYLFYRNGKRNINWILVILIYNILFNCLFESMFQRQSGIVFYTFWLCLLYCYSEYKSSIASQKAVE